MKNMNISNELMNKLVNKVYVFPYTVYENYDHEEIHSDCAAVRLSEEELLWFEQKRETGYFENKRYSAEVPKWLRTKIEHALTEDSKQAIVQACGCFDHDDFCVGVDFLPQGITYACDMIGGKTECLDEGFEPHTPDAECMEVEVKYTIEHNGETLEETCRMGMDVEIAGIMREAFAMKPADAEDFDYLKVVAPKAYEAVYNDICCWCNNRHLDEWKVPMEVRLKDFPVEIYI